MKKYILRFLTLVLIGAIGFFACKKDTDSFTDTTEHIEEIHELDLELETLSNDILQKVNQVVRYSISKMDKPITKNNILVNDYLKIESKSVIGDLNVMKMVVNLGENFQYNSGDPIVTLFLLQNNGENECTYVSLAESSYLQLADSFDQSKQIFPTVLNAPSTYHNNFWNIDKIGPGGFLVQPIIYSAPAVDTLASFGNFTTFIKKHPFSQDSNSGNNVRRVVVSVSP